MKQLYTNNAKSVLSASITDEDEEITIDSDDAELFAEIDEGNEYQVATLVEPLNPGKAAEIVIITARDGQVLTVQRGAEGTTAQAWSAGVTQVQGRITAGTLEAFPQQDTQAAAGALGLAGATASGNRAVAIGQGTKASNSDAIAVGASCEAHGYAAASFGYDSEATGSYSMALGINAESFGEKSVALGLDAESWAMNALGITAIPALQRGYQGDNYVTRLMGLPTMFAAPFVELAEGKEWQAESVYRGGDIVIPSTPNGFSYRLFPFAKRDFDYETKSFDLNFEATTGETEPEWTTKVGFDVAANDAPDAAWVCISLEEWFVEIPDNMMFFPDEIGFICTDYEDVTGPPSVSVGTLDDPMMLVDNEALSDVNGPNTVHRFSGFNQGLNGIVKFTLEAPATGSGSTMQGRFYMRGTFVQLKGNV
jgi:hypothetical protein